MQKNVGQIDKMIRIVILEPVLERTILVSLEAGIGDAHRTGRQLTRNNEQEAG